MDPIDGLNVFQAMWGYGDVSTENSRTGDAALSEISLFMRDNNVGWGQVPANYDFDYTDEYGDTYTQTVTGSGIGKFTSSGNTLFKEPEHLPDNYIGDRQIYPTAVSSNGTMGAYTEGQGTDLAGDNPIFFAESLVVKPDGSTISLKRYQGSNPNNDFKAGRVTVINDNIDFIFEKTYDAAFLLYESAAKKGELKTMFDKAFTDQIRLGPNDDTSWAWMSSLNNSGKLLFQMENKEGEDERSYKWVPRYFVSDKNPLGPPAPGQLPWPERSLQRLIFPDNWEVYPISRITDTNLMAGYVRKKNDDGSTNPNAVNRPGLLVPVDIVPDFNHDGKIDSLDQGKVTNDNPFHIWINDDNDSGDAGGDDIPGAQSPNYADDVVNGVRDLVDFFPISLELKQLLEVLPSDTYTYELRSSDGSLNAVLLNSGFAPKVEKSNSREYLTNVTTAQLLANPLTKTVHLTSGSNPNARLSTYFLDAVKADGYGVILVEGRSETPENSTSDLEIHVLKGTDEVCKVSFPMKLSSVEKMFRHQNLMGAAGGSGGRQTEMAQPANYPDKLCSDKKFVFVHGYNVNPEQARGWNAEMFKRLYWSGSKAKFYGVTWYGAESQRTIPAVGAKVSPDYHVNVRHALATGPALGSFISGLGSNVTVAAHSLGNMVLSSAIQEGGASPSNSFMIDSAVALECFNGGSPTETAMTYSDWNSYETRVWASEWYSNPSFGTGDGRKQLTWRDRFSGVGGGVYNFYSSSEDVLRKLDGDPNLGTVYFETARYGGRYAWASQEKLKGRRVTDPILGLYVGSTYGGWGFTSSYDDSTPPAPPHPHTPTANEAAGMSNQSLVTMPVFDPGYSLNYTTKVPHSGAPSWIASLTESANGSATAYANRPQLLAEMFPARTLPAGANLVQSFGATANFNMPAQFITDLTAWPNSASYNGVREWRHSDAREVAYTYFYKLFDKFKQLGELDK
jgi:hypothetical protein